MERERKFLVESLPHGFRKFPHSRIAQGYLAAGRGVPEIRLRRKNRKPLLTVKQGGGSQREEHEIPLPEQDFRKLWPLTRGRQISKTRYKIPYDDLTIEVDVYQGPLRGLIVAEVEFPSAAAMKRFKPPDWFGREVTGRRRYGNASLAQHGKPGQKE